jgi:hypothetical protein
MKRSRKPEAKPSALTAGSLVVIHGHTEPSLVLETRERDNKLRLDKNTWFPPEMFTLYVPLKKASVAKPKQAPCCTSKASVLVGLNVGTHTFADGDIWSKCFTCGDTAKKVAA